MKKKPILIVSTILALLIVSVFVYIGQAAASSTKVFVTSEEYPGYYWCQHVNQSWSTDSPIDGKVTARNDGGEPAKTWVTTQANVSTPTTGWLTRSDELPVKFSEVKNIKIVDVKMYKDADRNIQGQPSISSDKKSVIIKGYSGNGITGFDTPNVCGGSPSMIYPFPITVTWEGEIDKPSISLSIEPSEYGLVVGETGQFKVYVKEGNAAKKLVPNSKIKWTSEASTSVSVNSTGTAKGLLPTDGKRIKITAYVDEYKQSVNGSVYVMRNPYDVPPPIPEPDPEEPEIVFEPPVVTLYGPQQVKMGDTFCLSANAFTLNGGITDWYWAYSGEGSPSGSGSCGLYYMSEGYKQVTVTVEDMEGLTASDTITIEVIPPTPVASFTVGGTLKENRKVTISNTSTSPTMFPIDWSQSYFTLRPTASTKLADVKYVGINGSHQQNGEYKIPLNDAVKNVDALFKLKGAYEVDLYVINTAGYSARYSDSSNPEVRGMVETIQIVEDEKPIAMFSAVQHLYRDPDNQNLARLFFTNQAYSNDNDNIARVIYTVIYDVNNDGLFTEPALTFDSDKLERNTQYTVTHPNGFDVLATLDEDEYLEVLTPRVGQYKVYQEVIESFGQPTIEEFIVEADYRRIKTD